MDWCSVQKLNTSWCAALCRALKVGVSGKWVLHVWTISYGRYILAIFRVIKSIAICSTRRHWTSLSKSVQSLFSSHFQGFRSPMPSQFHSSAQALPVVSVRWKLAMNILQLGEYPERPLRAVCTCTSVCTWYHVAVLRTGRPRISVCIPLWFCSSAMNCVYCTTTTIAFVGAPLSLKGAKVSCWRCAYMRSLLSWTAGKVCQPTYRLLSVLPVTTNFDGSGVWFRVSNRLMSNTLVTF